MLEAETWLAARFTRRQIRPFRQRGLRLTEILRRFGRTRLLHPITHPIWPDELCNDGDFPLHAPFGIFGLDGEKKDVVCQLDVRLKFWPPIEGALLGVLFTALQLVCSASDARSAALRLIAHTANRISSPINCSLCLFRSMNTLMARPSVLLSWFVVLSPSSYAARPTNARQQCSHGLSLLFPQASVLVGSLCQP